MIPFLSIVHVSLANQSQTPMWRLQLRNRRSDSLENTNLFHSVVHVDLANQSQTPGRLHGNRRSDSLEEH
ncbi:hypothetical protein TNIN_395051 [Trichonephila inaurata madagascariensis]|uniref:Uncharacterized protein n=1 Tax=Trichonephila inaurata madagascariensis TaxID=2747483 RepID=A0A8X7C365_9ARAC|nr:hypothetical protein TNIN_395051 [Trichonephila inaurata madagascariensis]